MISALACPLWLGSHDRCPSPCSDNGTPEQCPLIVCQLSAPYLATDAGVHTPTLPEFPFELITSSALGTSMGTGESLQHDAGVPLALHRPLFLQTHSLLI